MRRKTRNFMLGKVGIGSNHPVTIQSMCNTATSDAAKTLAQINEVAQAGCDIIRVSADKDEDIRALYEINEASPIPVVADIQFASEMAVKAIDAKCSAVRVNPGIVRDAEALRPLAAKAIETNTPIRVGANAGSLPRHEIESRLASGMTHDDAIADALCQAALEQCSALEKFGVNNIKVALKCSSVPVTIKACRRFAGLTDYPLHLGLTEAGTPARGTLKSAAALGGLLLDGIGDTLSNLKAAAAGEHEEWTEMYREFSEVAAAEGFDELSRLFARVAEIEKRHENRYNKLVENMEKGEVYVKTGPQRWECRNCGHIHIGEKAPELCPTCKHPQSYFEIEAANY